MWKIFRRRKRRQLSPADTDLERFFTDAEEARARFQTLLTSPAGDRRIVVVHGLGAVGKSSLLRMFRLACLRQQVPVALVGGEEVPSIVDLLDRWTVDLKADIDLIATTSTLTRYRKLQTKVAAEAGKAGTAQTDAADKLTVAAAQGIVKVAASAIPVAGPLVGAVGSEGVEGVLNLLRAVLSRADYAFFLDPTPRLTEDFLSDLRRAAERRRIVLMLDTIERTTTLSDWLRQLAQDLPDEVLLVVAGQVIPSWDRAWPGWVSRAEIIELVEMSDENIERLVRQYHALFNRGEPEPDQVAAVVRFARGLPMAATTAVQLWMTYHLTDLQPVGSGAIADLADRLLEGVPVQTRPAFEAAAALRYFNVDSLAALLADGADAGPLYDEVRRWPFTRPREAGLAIHDTMRDVMMEALASRSPEQFRRLNERAAAYYAQLLASADSEMQERFRLEWLYHSIRADEATGIEHFRNMAEELVRYQWVSRLRALMNDVNTYPLRMESSQGWRRYYAARLEQAEGRSAVAEAEYLAIGYDDSAEPRLRAYALCDLGAIYVTFDRLAEDDGEQRARDTIQASQLACPTLESKLLTNHISLMNLSNTRATWAESLEHLRPVRACAESTGDAYGLVTADQLESTIRGLFGDWLGYLDARRRCEATLQRLGDVPALRMQAAYFSWPLLCMGRYREAQEANERALKLAIRLEEKELMITILESLGLALGMQDAYAESAKRFGEAWNFYENFHLVAAHQDAHQAQRYVRALLSFRGLVALRDGRLETADEDLRRALSIKEEIQDHIGIPELRVWRGVVAELGQAWNAAETAYRNALSEPSANRRYFESTALAGLVRINYARGRYDDCADDVRAAEVIAQRYEYNDVMASLRLFQGHLAWWSSGGQDSVGMTALGHYQEALTYALRYNRYLLDEIVGGRRQGTPLTAIAPICLGQGPAGRTVLRDIREWWSAGNNELRSERAESVSPLKSGIPLLDAEREARARERGSGEPQRTVLERIDEALANG